jgi:O-antigen/teichoic acid export membrane protein
LADGVAKIAKLFLYIYIAKNLGVLEYGKFSFALAFVGLFIVVSDLNISKIVTRDFVQDKDNEADFPSILSLEVVLSLISFLFIFSGSFFVTHDLFLRKIILILAVYSLISVFPFIFYAFFVAREKIEYRSWSEMSKAVITTALCVFVLTRFPSVLNLSWAYLIGAFVSLFPVVILFNWKFQEFRLAFSYAIWKKYLISAWPLALAGLLGSIYLNFDSTFMGFLGKIEDVGLYGAAQKIAGAALIIFSFFSVSFYPALNKAYLDNNKFQQIWNKYFSVFLFFIIPILTFGLIFATKIITFVYSHAFTPAVVPFQILLLGLALGTATSPFGQLLVVSQLQKRVFWITLWVTILSIFLNLVLIPKYSLYGAAVSVLASGTLGLALYIYYGFKLSKIKPINFNILGITFLSLVSAAAMGFVLMQNSVAGLNVFLFVAIGFFSYLLSFYLFYQIFNFLRSNLSETLGA